MRNRVFTYITRQRDLLIFEHVDQRYLDPQIPGGTIEPGEKPHAAALREAHEETGLNNITLVSFLGSLEKDLAPLGRKENIHAWFFHLRTSDQTPPRWRHFEQYSSDSAEPIEFELYWVPITQVPQLGGLDGTMIPKVLDTLA